MLVFCLLWLSAACEAQPQTAQPVNTLSTPTATFTVDLSPTATQPVISSTSSPSPEPFICDENWQALPVVPDVTETVRNLYQQGIANDRNPQAFSKIGDGEISTEWFFTAFDLGAGYYDLAEYQNLTPVIENFQGSFAHKSVSAKRGFNTNLILDPSAADPALCTSGESPLSCELRIYNPSIALLSLGTNQVHRPEEFEAGLRQILDLLVANQVVPILSTKGDNLEGDHRINRTIACLAQEYQVPLWNFWAAIQPLPGHGLQPDLEHLTYAGINDFDDARALQSAWTIRNLTALQVLNAVWQGVTK